MNHIDYHAVDAHESVMFSDLRKVLYVISEGFDVAHNLGGDETKPGEHIIFAPSDSYNIDNVYSFLQSAGTALYANHRTCVPTDD